MAPQKPASRTPRGAGLPKASIEPTSPAADKTPPDELPSDLTALANILGAAMATDAPPDRDARTHPKPQVPQPKSQEQPLTSRIQAFAPSEPTEGEATAFDEVARSLAAAEACVPLLAESTGLLRIAALDVVKAETARAGGLLQLLRFLRGDVVPPITVVSTSAVVQRVAQALESERRLRSVALTTRSSVTDAACAGDESLLSNALLALLLITFAAIERVQNARVLLSVTVNDAGEIGLAVSQDHVAAPAAWMARSGSDQLVAEQGQAMVAVAISAAHRIVSQWGGRFALASGDHSSILTIWLPVLQPPEAGVVPH